MSGNGSDEHQGEDKETNRGYRISFESELNEFRGW